ncbi:MAG: hypothetical protein PHS88_03220, partial [Candidatus Omnitrophica bacterium]|nr:hypothetical protein [Candidatus Omnitrophota bacterium]
MNPKNQMHIKKVSCWLTVVFFLFSQIFMGITPSALAGWPDQTQPGDTNQPVIGADQTPGTSGPSTGETGGDVEGTGFPEDWNQPLNGMSGGSEQDALDAAQNHLSSALRLTDEQKADIQVISVTGIDDGYQVALKLYQNQFTYNNDIVDAKDAASIVALNDSVARGTRLASLQVSSAGLEPDVQESWGWPVRYQVTLSGPMAEGVQFRDYRIDAGLGEIVGSITERSADNRLVAEIIPGECRVVYVSSEDRISGFDVTFENGVKVRADYDFSTVVLGPVAPLSVVYAIKDMLNHDSKTNRVLVRYFNYGQAITNGDPQGMTTQPISFTLETSFGNFKYDVKEDFHMGVKSWRAELVQFDRRLGLYNGRVVVLREVQEGKIIYRLSWQIPDRVASGGYRSYISYEIASDFKVVEGLGGTAPVYMLYAKTLDGKAIEIKAHDRTRASSDAFSIEEKVELAGQAAYYVKDFWYVRKPYKGYMAQRYIQVIYDANRAQLQSTSFKYNNMTGNVYLESVTRKTPGASIIYKKNYAAAGISYDVAVQYAKAPKENIVTGASEENVSITGLDLHGNLLCTGIDVLRPDGVRAEIRTTDLGGRMTEYRAFGDGRVALKREWTAPALKTTAAVEVPDASSQTGYRVLGETYEIRKIVSRTRASLEVIVKDKRIVRFDDLADAGIAQMKVTQNLTSRLTPPVRIETRNELRKYGADYLLAKVNVDYFVSGVKTQQEIWEYNSQTGQVQSNQKLRFVKDANMGSSLVTLHETPVFGGQSLFHVLASHTPSSGQQQIMLEGELTDVTVSSSEIMKTKFIKLIRGKLPNGQIVEVRILNDRVEIYNEPMPPVIRPIEDQTVREGMEIRVPIHAQAIPPELGLRYSAFLVNDLTGQEMVLPAWMTLAEVSIDGVTELVFSPEYSCAGDYHVRVKVSNQNGEAKADFRLEVENVALPPEMDAVTDQQMNEGGTLNIPIRAHSNDPDAGVLSLEVIMVDESGNEAAIPDWFQSMHTTGQEILVLIAKPGYDVAGTYHLCAKASDKAGEVKIDFQLTVENVMLPPVIEPVSDQELKEGEELRVGLHVQSPDPDHGDLTLSAFLL